MNFFLYFIWIFVLKKKFGHFISPKIAYLTFPALQFGSRNESSKSCGRIAFEFGLRPPCHGWLGIGRTTLHSMSGFGTQQPSSYCQYETTQQSTQLVFLFEKKNPQTVIHSGEKLLEKVSFFTYSVFKNSNTTVLNAINTSWKHCVNETFSKFLSTVHFYAFPNNGKMCQKQ